MRCGSPVSSDLRAAERNRAQTRSIYPVHAAVGLTVSETILYGCQPVIVEGRSDQIYLSAVKNYLIGKGLITPARELVFIPSGGVRGVAPITSIITGTEEDLPYAVLDSDEAGRSMAQKLKSNLYGGADDRILMLGDFVSVDQAEIEDLFPTDFLARIIGRYLRGFANPEEYFDDIVDGDSPIVPQVKEYAKQHGIELELGWKVDVAKDAKRRVLGANDPMKNEDNLLKAWTELFERLQP